jgi:hypothetical protein
MDLLRKAAEAALEALRYINQYSLAPHNISLPGEIDTAVDALRAALAQPDESFCDSHCTWHNHHPDCFMARTVQGPVAWLRQRDNTVAVNDGGLFGSDWTPLYTAPPQRKPLTEDDIELAYREIWRDLSDGFSHTSAEWIEAGIRYAEKVHGIE